MRNLSDITQQNQQSTKSIRSRHNIYFWIIFFTSYTTILDYYKLYYRPTFIDLDIIILGLYNVSFVNHFIFII